MPADMTGIENVGEFFSQHYVDELLFRDLDGLRQAWARGSGKPPPDRLRALGRDLVRLQEEAARTTRPERLHELSHALHVRIAEALGYESRPTLVPLDEGRGLPVLHHSERQGEPYLWILEGRFHREEEGLFELEPLDVQFESFPDTGLRRPRASLADLVSEAFALESPPRWILLLSGAEIVLAERPKWGRGQYLAFDLAEILGRRDPAALAVTCGLTCRDALVPEQGAPVHDGLDESSHKHAHGVSSELKYAARKAVELLGNEYVHYQRTVGKKALHSDRAAAELTAECLTYLYRLLFLFYAEARAGELRSLPMNAEEYLFGYSLEALRDLELVPLTTPEAQDGYFLHESLTRLFSLVDRGWEKAAHRLPGLEQDADVADGFLERGFHLKGLHSPLFDQRHTPRLSSVKFRNKVLQEVIVLLSLSGEGRRGTRQRQGRGRISYAQLGINQLGAVYEGLLSYTGFFSRERLHEVHRAGEEPSETDQAFFVPEREIHRYTEEERLFTGADGERRPRVYEPGTFIFRLAGRNRETSASYYTPEVLTRCLVKYSLKELLQEKTADDILTLTVCEPALGSGAFVVEAIDQLADAYLERKQAELGQRLAPDVYGVEKQKVKAFIAERNCYGVDLNPMAARLAEVSLWLATMHEGQSAPWFGARLGAGNSLVGARLAVWEASDLDTDDRLAKAITKKLKTHGERSDLDEAIEELLRVTDPAAADAVAAIRAVLDRAESRTAAPDADTDAGDGEDPGDDGADDASGEASEDEKSAADPRVELLKQLKKTVQSIKRPRYQRKPPVELSLAHILAGKHSPTSIYHFLLPDPGMSPFDKDKAVKELVPDAVAKLSAWRKTLDKPFAKADAPRLIAISRRIDQLLGHALEDRQAALAVTRGPIAVWGQPPAPPPPGGWRSIDGRTHAHRLAKAEGRAYHRLRLVMDLWAAQWAWPLEHAALLPTRNDWWTKVEPILGVDSATSRLAEQLELEATRNGSSSVELSLVDDDTGSATCEPVTLAVHRIVPFHWPLEFLEVFAGGGFDLIVGNPPWIKLQWNEQGILGDIDPRVVLDGLSAAQVARHRSTILGDSLPAYLAAFESIEGAKTFLNAIANYPFLEGVQTNLYKCFVEQGWRFCDRSGVVGLIHQDGVFDDARGSIFRGELYRRLAAVYRFRNELKLFADIGNVRRFCLSVSLGATRQSPSFSAVANLFHPATVDQCWSHDGAGRVPGMKDEDENFEVRGHRSRIVHIDAGRLALFQGLFELSNKTVARLPQVHSEGVVDVLTKLAAYPYRLANLADRIHGLEMWHETNAEKDGTIVRRTQFPAAIVDWIVSGPSLYPGNALYKQPREGCRNHRDFEVIDLEEISSDFLPRTNFVPACNRPEFLRRMPVVFGKRPVDFFRYSHRRMVVLDGERTLMPAILPAGPSHINAVFSVVFEHEFEMLVFCSFASTLVADFWIRSSGKTNLRRDPTWTLPFPQNEMIRKFLVARCLRLNCLTSYYRPLWERWWPSCAGGDSFSCIDARVSSSPDPDAKWSRSVSLRTAFARRLALVEMDALAALECGLAVDELCSVYVSEFSVLNGYESNTWYDARGRIAFTNRLGVAGVGLPRRDFQRWQASIAAGEPAPADIDTKGLEPPFDRCDREEDMRRAYYFFAEKLGIDIPDPPDARTSS